MMSQVSVNKDSMKEAARSGFSTATDLADYLVRAGIPFRDSHDIVGKAVRLGVDSGRDLSEIPLNELQQFSDQIKADVYDVLTLEGSVAARDHIGGTAPKQVLNAVKNARSRLSK